MEPACTNRYAHQGADGIWIDDMYYCVECAPALPD